MKWTRRQWLHGAAGLAAASCVGGVAEAAPTVRRRPRSYVMFSLQGGVDAVYTTNPRRARDVEPWVEVPYAPSAIVDGPVRLGPHFRALAPFADRLAVVNGVEVRVANHQSGNLQLLRMRTDAARQMPALFDVVAAARPRDEQPVGTISVGAVAGAFEHSPFWIGWIGEDEASRDPAARGLFRALQDADADDLAVAARALRANARELGGTARGAFGEAAFGAHRMDEAAALLEAVARLPRFVASRWSADPVTDALGVSMQRALWALEHDLAACIWVRVGDGGKEWDSHFNNAALQTAWNTRFAETFARFLGELDRRSNAHGPLSGTTVVVAGSELGRFPALNALGGKDHFPEAPYLLYGAPFRTGRTYGATGRRMESLAVSPADGTTPRAGGIVPVLDDLGTTLLHVAGLDPERYGYAGRVLRYLLA